MQLQGLSGSVRRLGRGWRVTPSPAHFKSSHWNGTLPDPTCSFINCSNTPHLRKNCFGVCKGKRSRMRPTVIKNCMLPGVRLGRPGRAVCSPTTNPQEPCCLAVGDLVRGPLRGRGTSAVIVETPSPSPELRPIKLFANARAIQDERCRRIQLAHEVPPAGGSDCQHQSCFTDAQDSLATADLAWPAAPLRPGGNA